MARRGGPAARALVVLAFAGCVVGSSISSISSISSASFVSSTPQTSLSSVVSVVSVSSTLPGEASAESSPSPADTRTRFCEFYNETVCPNGPEGCGAREECRSSDFDKRNHCFVLWRKNNATGNSTVQLKGCFMDNHQCYDKARCVDEAYARKNDVMFCCCEGDMCNSDFLWSPAPTDPPPATEVAGPVEDAESYAPVLYSALFFALLLIFAMAAFFLWGREKSNFFNELPTAEPSPSCPPSPEGLDGGLRLQISLLEVRARGRFGAVWRAYLNDKEVAVKIFPVQEKPSWLCEQEIYKLPRMSHSNILQFINVEKRGDNLQAEYWLISAYHEKGSLCDYLKANTITWEEAWQVAFTMARGLTHLHDEVPASQAGGRKPAVAHRDFKSKNVLLKHDMSACIADFGLALIFQPGVPCGDTHGQVGTRRYMAPEVLEGAINFTRDAFLRIDMYACGLVLWEIASRCTTLGGTGEYMLPLEEEVGTHPSLEEMQEAVVNRKLRPVIPESWRKHNAMHVFCDTMEECWDHDAEARLSASCIMERIGALRRARHSSAAHAPLLIENARPLPPISNRDN